MKKYAVVFLLLLATTLTAAEPLKVVIMGDNRPEGAIDQPYIFFKMISKIASLSPDAVFSTGDIVEGYSEDLAEMCTMYDSFDFAVKGLANIPFFIAPGNHDMVAIPHIRNEYIKRYGKTYFSVDLKNCRFICLSSEEPNEEFRIAGEQLAWLKQELADAAGKAHIFVVLHQPFYPKISHIGTSLDRFPDERDELVKLLKKAGVEMVFCGHNHFYNYTVKNGFHQMTTGGAGAPLYGSAETEGGFYHFIMVIIDGDDVDYRLVTVENELDIAASLRRQKKYAAAQSYVETALQLQPDHPEAHISAALLYSCRKENKKFNAVFNRLQLLLKNNREEAWLNLAAAAYIYDANLDLALDYYNHLFAEKPDSFRGYYQLAQLFYDRKDSDKALQYFLKAADANKEYYRAFFYAAKILMNKKDYKAALINLEKALAACTIPSYRDVITAQIEACKKGTTAPDPR